MIYTRQFWYDFFSELGFLIMPCGFNWHSTTNWLFDSGVKDEVALDDERFMITFMGVHCFFYRLSPSLLKQHLSLFRLTDSLVRHRLAQTNILLNIPASYAERSLPNIDRYEGKKILEGFSLRAFACMISVITNQIDPMDWQKEAPLAADYLTDFDTYGFCFLTISRQNN